MTEPGAASRRRGGARRTASDVRALLRAVEAPRARWAAILALGCFLALLEVVASALVYLVVVSASGAAERSPALGLQPVERQHLGWLALGAATFFLLRAALLAAQSLAQHRTAQLTGVQISSRLARTYLEAPYEWHLTRSSSEVVRNVYDAVDKVVYYVLVPALSVASEAAAVLALVFVLGVAAPLPTALAVVLVAPALLLFTRVVHPRLTAVGHESAARVLQMLHVLQAEVHGGRDIRLYDAREEFGRRFRDARMRMATTAYRRSTLIELPRIGVEAIAVVFVVVFLCLTAWREGASDGSLGVLGIFGYAVLRVLPAANRVMTHRSTMETGVASLDVVLRDLAITPESPPGASVVPLRAERSVELRGVAYAYPGGEGPVLRGVNLEVPAGAWVGLVGPTGSGKSTMVDVLLGLLPPSAGEVLVDGVSLRGRERSWQAQVGVVSQQVFLLDGTVRDNIAFGVPSDDVDEAQVLAAAAAAQLDDVLAASPSGLDALVGENGIRLSGGQRQRIGIARALYRRPGVLVLDEGTAAQDATTEQRIVEAVAALRGRLTMVTIAHRLSTVRQCDSVALVVDGRVLAQGRFDDLVRDQPLFREMARLGGAH